MKDIMNNSNAIINDKRKFPLHEQSRGNSFAKKWGVQILRMHLYTIHSQGALERLR